MTTVIVTIDDNTKIGKALLKFLKALAKEPDTSGIISIKKNKK